MSQNIKVARNSDRIIELNNFLMDQIIGSLATSNGSNLDIATVFYVFDKGSLFFKSRTGSGHSKNVSAIANVSFSVYSHESDYAAKFGVQIRGTVSRILDEERMENVVNLYSARFEGAGAKLPSMAELCSPEIQSTFYELRIQSFKIIDEDKEVNRSMLDYQQYL